MYVGDTVGGGREGFLHVIAVDMCPVASLEPLSICTIYIYNRLNMYFDIFHFKDRNLHFFTALP